ncbi:zinc ribbon domain-containing protein [Streptomyces sp. NBC_01613]|uniref:NADase-type glycan-binding domain-containing protein n=1 Tax=Streptomyces sp. NBC_01613 TaxID=2975896 RepID=UPI003867F761
MSGSGGNTGGSPQGAGGYGGASDGGPGDPSFATSPAGSAASAGSSAPVPAAQASGPGAGPGWDAFARADGGAGLARTPRDLLSAGTTTTEPGASADQAAASHQDSQPSASRTPGGTGAADRSGSAPSPTAASHPVTPPVDDTAPTEPVPASTASADADADADAEGMTDRARRLLVPVADPEPRPTTTPSVAPVLPGRPAAQRPQAVRAPGEELGADGGTPCPWCATRNRPDRHFCTRCAMPMAGEAQAPARLPWWRRLVGLGNRETPWAGDRPRLRRTFDRILTWLGAAIVLTVLIMLAFNIPKAVQATRDHFSKRASVAPDSYSASRSYQGHPPRLLFDKYRNTWWGPGVADSGKGQWVEARFDEPTRLLDLIITPGVSTQAAQLSQSALPHRVKATITLANGKTTTRELVLDQSAGGQRVSFRVGEVTAVRFTIESSYQTSGSKQVAIAEIEFFGPSHAS